MELIPKPIKQYKNICKDCGRDFTAKSRRIRCNDCLAEFLRPKEKTFHCEECHKEFKATTLAKRKYCDECLTEKRANKSFLEFKRVAVLPNGEQVPLTVKQELIAEYLGMAYDEFETAKIVTMKGKKASVKYIKRLMDGKCSPENFPKLVHYLLNKNMEGIKGKIDAKLVKRIDMLDAPTKKDPLDWYRLLYERFAPLNTTIQAPPPKSNEPSKEEMAKTLEQLLKNDNKETNEGNKS